MQKQTTELRDFTARKKELKTVHRFKCKNLCILGLGKDFLDTTMKALSLKEKLINWTSLKLNFQSSKTLRMSWKRWKRQARDQEKIITNHVFDKDLNSESIKNSGNSIGQTTQFLKNGQKILILYLKKL